MAEKYQLKNGLTVLLVESHKSPVVSVQMWVRTGSADEQEGQEGISHFIEHLVFKGTEKFAVGEVASQVESHGGEINAYTSFDQTVFYVTISKQFAEKGLDVISQMMGFPSFVGEEIDNERGVVIEEIKRGRDSAPRQASRMMFSTIYEKHPYGLPVIGYEEIIEKVTREEIVEYYESRYVPDNMTLLIVGDFSSEQIKGDVEKYFGSFKPHTLKEVTRPREPEQTSPRVVVKESNFEESYLFLTWRGPNVHHEDVIGLDVLSMILGQGESSRLMKSLRIEEPITNYTTSGTYTPINEGFLAIQSSLNEKNLNLALEKILAEVKTILTEPPSIDEMVKALTNLESERYYSLETVDGMANTYGTYERLFDDYEHYKIILDQARNLTTADLTQLARKYMKPETLSLCLMTNAEDLDSCKATLNKFSENFSEIYKQATSTENNASEKVPLQTVAWAPNKNKDQELRKIELDSGATLILQPNHETPIVNLRGAFLGGLRQEPVENIGLTELLSRVWTAGTSKLTEQEIALKVESMAARLSAFGGRNTAGLNMTSLSGRAAELFDLFSQVLQDPALDESIIEREKHMMKEHLKNRDDNPAQQAILSFIKSMFGQHPYSRDPYGTEESVSSLTSSHLREHLSSIKSAKNLVMVLGGDFNEGEYVKKIEAMTAHLPEGERLNSHFDLDELTADDRQFKKLDKEQSHIVLGYRGLTFTDSDRYALDLIQSILSGQGGRLFIELRDKESLAYSVAPLRLDGIDAGYFGAYIGCSPEKAEKSILMLRQELEKIMNDKVSAEEMARSKRYLIGKHDISLQRTSAMAASILFDDIYGVDYRETFRYPERLQQVTADQIQALAQKLFSQPQVLSLVGPTCPW